MDIQIDWLEQIKARVVRKRISATHKEAIIFLLLSTIYANLKTLLVIA